MHTELACVPNRISFRIALAEAECQRLVADRMNKKGVSKMGFRKAATTVLAAASMMALPTAAMAQTASASKLSVAGAARTSANVEGNELAGGSLIIAVLAAAAVIAGIVIAADSDDSPNSP